MVGGGGWEVFAKIFTGICEAKVNKPSITSGKLYKILMSKQLCGGIQGVAKN